MKQDPNNPLYYESKLKYFDGVSEYGIFKTAHEESRMAEEGVYKYRLHRTISFMDKHGFIAPMQNIYLARDIAAFIIKLTDAHLKNILTKALTYAKLSSQNKVCS